MKQPKLLVSDVDFTLLGDDSALGEFRQWFDTQDPPIRLVLASGRFVDSIAQSIRETEIPDPEVVIGGVGTECRVWPSGENLPGWREQHSGWNAQLVRELLRPVPELEPQPEEFQSEFKASYFLHDATNDQLQVIHSVLAAGGLAAEIVYSSARDLDVLPAGCNKGTAAEFVAEYLGFHRSDVIVCGDSSNDLAMFDRGFSGIVVGNGSPELKSLDGPRVYKSSRPFAGGIVEGLEYWLDPTTDVSAADRVQS